MRVRYYLVARLIQISLLAVLLLCGTAALADDGYVTIDVPRGYQGGLARDQAAFVAYPLAGNTDFGVTFFDGLALRSLVDDDNFRFDLVVSNDLVAWSGPPDLFSYDGHQIDNLTALDDNFYIDIAVGGDRLAWARLNPETFDYDIVLPRTAASGPSPTASSPARRSSRATTAPSAPSRVFTTSARPKTTRR